jgi:O-phosphoseryl-tRNA(Cys) synthetase
VKDDLVKFDSEGISVHVFDSDRALEHLRFDVFNKDPHYHYIGPDGSNQVVVYDRAACGDMWDWTKSCLLDRLTDMLVQAGANDLAQKVDRAAVKTAMVEIEELAKAEAAVHAVTTND